MGSNQASAGMYKGMANHCERDARPVVSFMLRGLPEREAKLLRSFVQLVNHRTQHRWEWRETGADLLVVHGETGSMPADARSGLVLRVGGRAPQGAARPGAHLSLPYRADAVEACLNALGTRALAVQQDTAQPPPQVPEMLLQLLRWPPTQLLTGPEHIRLAALMTGHPITMKALCQRSGLPPETCAAFLNRLDAAGLLRWAPTGSEAARPARSDTAPRPGVLDRIRRRLGQLTGGNT